MSFAVTQLNQTSAKTTKLGQTPGLSHWPVTRPDPTRRKSLTQWPVTRRSVFFYISEWLLDSEQFWSHPVHNNLCSVP